MSKTVFGESEYQTVILEERMRLARELHDGPVQALTVIALRLGLCQRLTGQGDLAAVNQELARLANSLQRGLVDLRRIVADLRQPVSSGQQLADMLFKHIEGYCARTGQNTTLDLRDASLLERLSDRQQAIVLLVVQEALENVHRYADASRVRIAIRSQANELEVCIEDDGCGFDMDRVPNQGLYQPGLAIMREWAKDAGGTLRVESQPGQGCRVILTMPLQKPPMGGMLARD